MIIKNGNNKNGLSGIKSFKNSKLWVNRPIKKIDSPRLNDKHKIITIWLVKAIPNGIKLIKLHKRIKQNKEKIKGKYIYPLGPTCWSNIAKRKLYNFSNTNCQKFGTSVMSKK